MRGGGLKRFGITAASLSIVSPGAATVLDVQRVSANAIQALKDALTAAFW
ncbi:MAG: hypothetical protein ACRDPC_05790 [Solirubrobacteraceae bacterium]